jgi:hypothetical protein
LVTLIAVTHDPVSSLQPAVAPNGAVAAKMMIAAKSFFIMIPPVHVPFRFYKKGGVTERPEGTSNRKVET